MSSQRARTEYPIFMRKNRGRLPSSPPTASAASLDVSTGRSNFRTEIRHPAVPQTATRTIPIIALLPHPSKHQPLSTSLHTQGHRRESRHPWRLWRWCPFRRYRTFVCPNRMDLLGVAGHGAILTTSIFGGRHTDARRAIFHMARRGCVPSLSSPWLQGFRIVSHKCSLWPTVAGQIFRAGGFAECAEQNRPDPSQAGAVDISRTQKWVREPTDDFFIGNEQGSGLRLARCLCLGIRLLPLCRDSLSPAVRLLSRRLRLSVRVQPLPRFRWQSWP